MSAVQRMMADEQLNQMIHEIDFRTLTKAKTEIVSFLLLLINKEEDETVTELIRMATENGCNHVLQFLQDLPSGAHQNGSSNDDRQSELQALKKFGSQIDDLMGTFRKFDGISMATFWGSLALLKLLFYGRSELSHHVRGGQHIFSCEHSISHRIRSPMHLAAQLGKKDCLEFILSQKEVDINALEFKWSPLRCAIQGKQVSCVKLLLDCGASLENNITSTDASSESSLPNTCSIEDMPIIYFTLSQLRHCKDSLSILKILLLSGARVNAAYEDPSKTPLQYAIMQHYFQAAKLLISHGADVNHEMSGIGIEQCPLQQVCYRHGAACTPKWVSVHVSELVTLLLGRGADFNASWIDDNGNCLSPLFYFKNYPDAPGSISYNSWKEERALWQLRSPYLMLVESHPEYEGHIARYLFDAMLVREICSFLGVYEAPVEIIRRGDNDASDIFEDDYSDPGFHELYDTGYDVFFDSHFEVYGDDDEEDDFYYDDNGEFDGYGYADEDHF